jgi:hypothetical protein
MGICTGPVGGPGPPALRAAARFAQGSASTWSRGRAAWSLSRRGSSLSRRSRGYMGSGETTRDSDPMRTPSRSCSASPGMRCWSRRRLLAWWRAQAGFVPAEGVGTQDSIGTAICGADTRPDRYTASEGPLDGDVRRSACARSFRRSRRSERRQVRCATGSRRQRRRGGVPGSDVAQHILLRPGHEAAEDRDVGAVAREPGDRASADIERQVAEGPE